MVSISPTVLARETEQALARLIAARPEVDVAVLFGSAAAARLGGHSDIDVYVRLRPGTRWGRAERSALATEASRQCGREVDLIVEDEATSVILRREVAARGRPLHEAR